MPLALNAIFKPTIKVNNPTDWIEIFCNLSENLPPTASPRELPTITVAVFIMVPKILHHLYSILNLEIISSSPFTSSDKLLILAVISSIAAVISSVAAETSSLEAAFSWAIAATPWTD